MIITSTAFQQNTFIPSKYTCDGENINPPLTFSDVPKGAKSLVLIMDDPDVPKSLRSDGMWDHWLIWNIQPDTKEIRQNATSPGVVGKNTGGQFAYQGPCPPDRQHRYFFKLFALGKTLDLPEGASKEEVQNAMKDHILESAELVGLYKRS